MTDPIRERLDFRELVAEYVALKPAGRDKFKGLSPFSKEKTPSFYVDVTKGLWYCFSTKQGGDCFDFLMKVEGIGFREALEKLAQRVGVTLSQPSSTHDRKRDLYDVNTLAMEFFCKQLSEAGSSEAGSDARSYLERRGVSEASIQTFGLGWAPNTWDGLLKHAKSRSVAERELLEAGLLSEGAESGRLYDRFRARITFPIRDYLGRVIGFGARVLDDSKPKYLNSPETAVFKKGETLYGLDLARKAIAQTGEAIVVEGYMDVIAMHEHGFTNAVATLGTALTSEHAHLLARLGARRLALLFDNDAAGQRATLAGLDQEIGRMFLVRAVIAPGGKDCADILLAGKRDELSQALEGGGLSEVEFRLQEALERFDISNLEGKKLALEALLPALEPKDVFDPVALEMRRLVIDRFGLDGHRLDEWLNARRRTTPGARRPRLDRIALGGLSASSSGAELQLARLLVQNPSLTAKLDGQAQFENPLVAEVITVAREMTSSEQILEHFRGRPEAQPLFEGVFTAPDTILEPQTEDFAAQQIASRKREEHLRAELSRVKTLAGEASSTELPNILRQVSELQRAIETEKRLRLRA